MKKFGYLLLVSFVFLVGCTSAENKNLYLNSKPSDLYESSQGNTKIDLLFYRDTQGDKFKLTSSNRLKEKIDYQVWGEVREKEGGYELFGQSGEELTLVEENINSIIIENVGQVSKKAKNLGGLNGIKLKRKSDLMYYRGEAEIEGYDYVFELKLFDREKPLPAYIIPVDYQHNSFYLEVTEEKAGNIISVEKYNGEWIIGERILILKLKDEMLHFKTFRNRLELITPENPYNIEKLELIKLN